MTMEQELKQQKRSHPATPRQEAGQSSLLQIRQSVPEHRHQEASTGGNTKGMQKTQNKGSTSNPKVAAAESMRPLTSESSDPPDANSGSKWMNT